jgi:hypothetical protein
LIDRRVLPRFVNNQKFFHRTANLRVCTGAAAAIVLLAWRRKQMRKGLQILMLTLVCGGRLFAATPAIATEPVDSPKAQTVDDRWIPQMNTDRDIAPIASHLDPSTAAPLADSSHPQVPLPAAQKVGAILLLIVVFLSKSQTAARWRRHLLH